MNSKNRSAQNTVLLVSPLPPPQGGIASWTERILGIASRHPEIQVLLVDIAPRWRKVTQRGTLGRALGGGAQFVRDFVRTQRLIRKERPSVLHLCTSGQLAVLRDIVLLRFAQVQGLRTVYHLRFGRLPALSRIKGWEWQLLRHAVHFADAVVSLDDQTHAIIREHYPQTHAVKVPNCVTDAGLGQVGVPSQIPGRTAQGTVVSYIGWVIPAKGVLELVQATVRLASCLPYRLEIIGPADPRYLNLLTEVGAPLGDRLCIRGELPHNEAMIALGQSDMLVLPSYTEGFPNVIVEAMALGKPIIGTDVGAIAEMILDNSDFPCGIVVPPGDVGALERALGELVSDPHKREVLGRNGQRRFKDSYECSSVFQSLQRIWFR